MDQLVMDCRLGFLLVLLAACARSSPRLEPGGDPELAADRARWDALSEDPNSAPKSQSDPYPGLFTDRRMIAAERCGVSGYLWRMPDMVRVIFNEGVSAEAK